MTDQNATQNDARTNDQAATRWVERFGKLTSVVKRNGKGGEFVTFEIDCVRFKQSGIAFSAKMRTALIEAGIGARVWVKGPIELRTVTKDGKSHQEEVFKAVYFKDRSVAAKPAQAEKAAEAGADEIIEDQVEAPAVTPVEATDADLENAFA